MLTSDIAYKLSRYYVLSRNGCTSK